MPYIDLHTHTTASDGTCSPTELVHLAKEKGLTAIAITDHDTVVGNTEGIVTGKELGITVIPGVEISAKYHDYTMHILGYGFDSQNRPLLALLDRLKDSRHQRNPQIITKLHQLGVAITYDDVLAQAKGETVGRPHIASAMVRKGMVRTIDDAFKRYLYDGGPAYVPKEIITPEEAFSIIIHAGGIPCLAHPWLLKRGITIGEIEQVVQAMIPLGLKGIEAYYGKSTPHQGSLLQKLADKYQLIVVGGSDFHGANRPDIKLGQAKVPVELLSALVF